MTLGDVLLTMFIVVVITSLVAIWLPKIATGLMAAATILLVAASVKETRAGAALALCIAGGWVVVVLGVLPGPDSAVALCKKANRNMVDVLGVRDHGPDIGDVRSAALLVLDQQCEKGATKGWTVWGRSFECGIEARSQSELEACSVGERCGAFVSKALVRFTGRDCITGNFLSVLMANLVGGEAWEVETVGLSEQCWRVGRALTVQCIEEEFSERFRSCLARSRNLVELEKCAE